MITKAHVISKLLAEGAVIFYSDYGKKAVTETWQERLKKEVKKPNDIKDYLNYHLITGNGQLVDLDLD